VVSSTTDVPGGGAPSLVLVGVWPNPSHGDRLSVSFTLPSSTPAHLELLDILGRRVVTREVGALGAGPHVVELSTGRAPPPGLYLVRLVQGTEVRMARVTVVN
jgi:hypothetical protein